MKKILLISALFTSLTAAADESTNWNGFYGSLMIGREWGHVSEDNGFSTYPYDPAPGADYYSTFGNQGSSINGWSGNLKAGYNKQIGTNLIGMEIGVTLQDAKANGSPISGWSNYPVSSGQNANSSLNSQTKVNSYETLNARIGHIFEDKTLVYLSGGLAVGKIKRTITQIGAQDWFDEGTVISDTKTELGYLLGFGLEHKLNEHIALRANYEYINFGNVDFKYTGPYTSSGFVSDTITQSNSIHFSNLSVGVTYSF